MKTRPKEIDGASELTKKVVKFINSSTGKKDDSFMVVAFDTSSSVPVAMALLKRNAYDPKHLQATLQHTFGSEMRQTTRKFIW